EDVRHVIGRIGTDADAESGIVLPNLHIGNEPDRKRIVAGPLERLALCNERVVVSARAADRPRRALRLGGGAAHTGTGKARRRGKAETLGNERPTVMTDALHGKMLPLPSLDEPTTPPHRCCNAPGSRSVQLGTPSSVSATRRQPK